MNDLDGPLSALHTEAPARLAERVLRGVGEADDYVEISGPRGSLYVAFNGEGISCVDAAGQGPDAFEEYFVGRFGRALRPADAPPRGLAHALETGDGRTLRYDLRGLTEFEVAVLGKALEIPRGEVRSYGWIAREIGRPKAVRAVGSALGHNPVPVVIPCHRVVRSDGMIGNYALGAPMKRQLLDTEGVDVDGIQRLAASGVRFVGSDTTRIFCVPTCHDARRVSERHRVTFRSERDATAEGYRPCKHCRPAESRSA
jgi:O-6-methylguanine DNA methyltransferase